MKKVCTLLFLLLFLQRANAQVRNLSAAVETQAIATSDQVPFWMRSNQFGSIPLSGISGSIIGRAARKYDSSRKRLFDWGAGFEGRVNAGKRAEFLLIEA